MFLWVNKQSNMSCVARSFDYFQRGMENLAVMGIHTVFYLLSMNILQGIRAVWCKFGLHIHFGELHCAHVYCLFACTVHSHALCIHRHCGFTFQVLHSRVGP